MHYESEWYKRQQKIQRIEQRAHCMKARKAPPELLKSTSRLNVQEEQMCLTGSPLPTKAADQFIQKGILKDDEYERMRETLRSAQQRDRERPLWTMPAHSSSHRLSHTNLHTHTHTHSPFDTHHAHNTHFHSPHTYSPNASHSQSLSHYRAHSPQRSPYSRAMSPQVHTRYETMSPERSSRQHTPFHEEKEWTDTQTQTQEIAAEVDWAHHPMVTELSKRTLTSSAGRRLLQATVKKEVEGKLKDAPFDITKAFPF